MGLGLGGQMGVSGQGENWGDAFCCPPAACPTYCCNKPHKKPFSLLYKLRDNNPTVASSIEISPACHFYLPLLPCKSKYVSLVMDSAFITQRSCLSINLQIRLHQAVGKLFCRACGISHCGCHTALQNPGFHLLWGFLHFGKEMKIFSAFCWVTYKQPV